MNNEIRPMKRGHSPDFEFNARGPFRGHPNQHFNKRHRGDNLPQTIEQKIAAVGEAGYQSVQIGNLAKDIDAELSSKVGEDEKIKNITSTICKCIVSFPTKIATYANLIGLISVKHYNVSYQIINSLHASYPVYLEAQKWQDAITIIHLLSSLVNCKVIRPSALLSQFELLLEITTEDNIPQARSDYYVYTVLSSLPIVASQFSTEEGLQEPFEKVLTTIETYLSKRSKDHLNTTRIWLSNDSTVQMDYLDSLWVQTKNFKANNWNEVFLHRPYNDKEYQDITTANLITQNSPTIQIPAHSPDYLYPSPRIVLRLFEDDIAEGHRQIPGSDKIERFCIENHIRSIIDEIPKDPKICLRYLSNIHNSNRLPMRHLLVETLLGELFTLPRPKHDEILYQSLLYEFTKIYAPPRNPDEAKYTCDVVINEAVKVLYENLDTMNTTCLDRFISWFSFHLNNTEYVFPWQTWTDATEKEKTSPKATFVQNILERCVRFTFYKKMNLLVSTTLSSLMPPEVEVVYKPVNADHPKSEELHETIKKLIVEKADGSTISQTLNIIIDGVEVPEDFQLDFTDRLLKIDIFTAVILKLASKSLTHLSSAIGKFRNVFKALTKVEKGQFQLLQTMHSCLEHHPQNQIILVDKLLKAELIEAEEVCNWIFSDSMKPHYLKSHPWELLHNVITHASKLTGKLIAQKEESESKPVEVEVKVEPGEESGMDVEMKPDVSAEFDEKITKAQSAYRSLIILVFEKFATILGNHIREKEISNTSYMDEYFRILTGRMQQVYYNHYDYTRSLYDEIRMIIDKTPSIGNSIINLNQ